MAMLPQPVFTPNLGDHTTHSLARVELQTIPFHSVSSLVRAATTYHRHQQSTTTHRQQHQLLTSIINIMLNHHQQQATH
eukprot:m.496181 g.496181  ORF g.496181 m.496181 type:complete len:79 (+) comp46773_c0_seq1:397-633(+)